MQGSQKEKTMIFPAWLRQRVNPGQVLFIQKFLKEMNIKTVCENALCPNRGECYARKTVTFMILGSSCTRNCRFCAVEKGKPESLNLEEPLRVAQAVKDLKLRHVVITSVTRDDLSDGGASQFVKVIKTIKKINPGTIIEALIPDFKGSLSSISKVVESGLHILNHNLDTVSRLYPEIRPEADYKRSLGILKAAKEIKNDIITKSGLMLGLGETFKEVEEAMNDLRKVNCDFLTLGQYLAPTSSHYPIKEFITPEIFERYKKIATEKGFSRVASGPWVRSSYYADKISLKKI